MVHAQQWRLELWAWDLNLRQPRRRRSWPKRHHGRRRARVAFGLRRGQQAGIVVEGSLVCRFCRAGGRGRNLKVNPSARRWIVVVHRLIHDRFALSADSTSALELDQQIESANSNGENEQCWNQPDVQHSSWAIIPHHAPDATIAGGNKEFTIRSYSPDIHLEAKAAVLKNCS